MMRFISVFLLLTHALSQSAYCNCGPTLTADTNLGPVSMIGEGSEIGETSNCPGTTGPRDFTNQIVDVVKGKEYQLNFTVSTCGGSYQSLAGAWIDWNQNNEFDSDETLGSFVSGAGAKIYTFNVPSTAILGTTRLRIQVQETTSTILNPCQLFAYGGTKDFSISVQKPQEYCLSGPTIIADASLASVTLIGDSDSIVNNDTGCPGKLGVQDLTSTHSADLIFGPSYTLSYTVVTCKTQYAVLSGAWIDWNHNDKFETDEQLFAFSSLYGIQSHNFQVPSHAITGMTRLRVQVQETQALSIDPCSQFEYGGTKDFSINIGGRGNGYCSSGPLNPTATTLGPTTLIGDSWTISDLSECPNKIGPQDLTNELADLTIGKSYVLDYTVATCGAIHSTLSGAWIDWNQNKVFETNEVLFAFSTSFGRQSSYFSVPVTASIGNTRMRVQVQQNTNETSLSPCAYFVEGGTKDFSITVKKENLYCNCGPTIALDTTLGGVGLVGDTRSISNYYTCPGVVGPQDYTNFMADLSIGLSYTLDYTTTTCGGQYAVLSGAWIDYNQDAIFSANEQLSTFSTIFGNNRINFTVPDSALTGITRLRVQVQESTGSSLNPCQLFAYGGTKDFSVQLKTPPYCSSGPTTTVDSNLGPVTLAGDSETISDFTNCPGQLGPKNLTNLVADLTRSVSYKIILDVTTCGNRFPTRVGAWIDWNQNGVFNDNEVLFPFSSTFGVQDYIFSVPPGAITGRTFLRVQVQETSSTNPLDPCYRFAYGGTKDFSIRVK